MPDNGKLIEQFTFNFWEQIKVAHDSLGLTYDELHWAVLRCADGLALKAKGEDWLKGKKEQ